MDDRLALAIKYYQSNLDDQAWALVEEVVSEPDPSVDALSMAATLSYERRDLDAAISYCDRVLAHSPGDAHTLLLKGRALSDQGGHESALVCLQDAVAADDSLGAAHYNLGWVRQVMGDVDGAITAYRAAVARQDPYPVAWNNLGLMLEHAGDGEGAVSAFKTAIRQFPGFSAAHNNLGAVLAAGGQFHAAANAYADALSADPDNVDARVNQGVALLETGDIEGAVTAFSEVRESHPGHAAATDNGLYAELYRRDDDAALRAEHSASGDAFVTPVAAKDLVIKSDSERLLKIGFLSPDFRRHSVSFFSLPLIRALNRRAFEVHLIDVGTASDTVTPSFQQAADHWHAVAGLGDDGLTQTLGAAGLDVLVDLAGRTTGNRLRALAPRVAPLQITALGYPGPSGVPAMDYWLCDAITNPPSDAEATLDRDRPLRLTCGLHVFGPPDDAPALSPLPALDHGRVTFGSFNKLAKLSDDTVDLWAAVLKAVEGSRLLLKARALTELETVAATKKRFAEAGVDPARVECRGWAADDRDHLALYAHIDIALDTTPYNGTTTTCEALWMGVPVLTLMGQGHAARVGASLLASAGLEDWAAETPEDFVRVAAAQSGDLAALAALRAGLREQISASALTDPDAAARAFETAVRQAWQELCQAV